MTEETSQQEIVDAVSAAVDDMLLSNYEVRLNLILILQSEEGTDPTLYQNRDGKVFSLAYPFTGVQVRLNPDDKEPTKASGYLSSHLVKVMTALNDLKGKPILRLGSKEDTVAYYKGLGRQFHAAAVNALPIDPPQIRVITELTRPEEGGEATQRDYVIDVYFSFTVSGTYAFGHLEKWALKLMDNSDKFVVPFRFTMAVSMDDLPILMNSASVPFILDNFEYSHTMSNNPPVPLYSGNAMHLLGKMGNQVLPHVLFTRNFQDA